MRQNALLSGPAQSPVSLVPLGDTEAYGDGPQLLGFLAGRGVAQGRSDTDEEVAWTVGQAGGRRGQPLGPLGICRQPAIHCLGQSHLKVEARQVAGVDWLAETTQGGGYVGMLEFDRSAGAADPLMEPAVVFGFIVAAPRKVVGKHGEVVAHDRVVLFVGPVFTRHEMTSCEAVERVIQGHRRRKIVNRPVN
jgi:hypothetical protein